METDYLNLKCEEIKKSSLSIESTIEEIYYSVSMQESDESYTVCKKMVLFFALSQDEFDSLCEDRQSDIGDALDDYYAYSNVLIKYLDEQSIHHDWTTIRKIIILYKNGEKEEIKFDKEIFIAWILFDGIKKPKIFTVGAQSGEMILEVENYFEIKQK